jgi:hypothetical protein
VRTPSKSPAADNSGGEFPAFAGLNRLTAAVIELAILWVRVVGDGGRDRLAGGSVCLGRKQAGTAISAQDGRDA